VVGISVMVARHISLSERSQPTLTLAMAF